MKIAITELRQKIEKTLNKNLNNDQARVVADYLLWAEMSGIKTQGIVKMIGSEPIQDIQPSGEIKVERDTKLSQLINAGANAALLVSNIATDTAISKAKEHGFSIVGVHNTFSSNGALSYYTEQIAKQDLIGIAASRSPGSTAPFDSIDPLFGTNPISFSFPTDNQPIVFDMATSAMTFYGLILANAKGESIPENMAIDHEGNPTTSPGIAMDGALLPFDRSYKSSGLGMVVEILTGPLTSAAYCDTALTGEWGSTFMAIDPNLLVDIAQFKSQCSDLVQKIKSSRKKHGVSEIRLPGEKSHNLYLECVKSGQVEVDEVILKQLGYV